MEYSGFLYGALVRHFFPLGCCSAVLRYGYWQAAIFSLATEFCTALFQILLFLYLNLTLFSAGILRLLSLSCEKENSSLFAFCGTLLIGSPDATDKLPSSEAVAPPLT